MQFREGKVNTNNPTLNKLIIKLSEECQNAITLVNQFQLDSLTRLPIVHISYGKATCKLHSFSKA